MKILERLRLQNRITPIYKYPDLKLQQELKTLDKPKKPISDTGKYGIFTWKVIESKKDAVKRPFAL